MKNIKSGDSIEHTINIRHEFRILINHLREDITKLNDPASKALFETSAEVPIGLEKAFTDFEEKTESARK